MKYILRISIIGLLFFLCTISSQAQELGFGFRAGWSYTSFKGPLLAGETNNFQSGIHIGPTISLKMNDRFGFHSGLFYNQMGNEYKFQSDNAYSVLINQSSRKILEGKVDKTLLVENTYIDIPLGGYVYLTDHLQVFGGINFGFLVSSTALGTLNFTNPEFNINYKTTLDHKYFKDNPGLAGDETVFTVPGRIDGQVYSIPDVLGGYYYHETKSKNLYNIFDFGVHAGFKYFLNGALYLSAQAYYGLTDINNNDTDLSPLLNDKNQLQYQEDKDLNISLQISLGFAF